ncbi:DUF3093 domain-containing protein [Agromyces archimandritae]|uniref:DUF3093 domain-containing protein n=1 Tax=Agromyces archimandritae TaxID=2781962 RepID=A0A975FLZ5_9MICO|nr:DUF3093 domain-containing protein [Agromyces archimandritae]QTX04569.1 DUF3093 domain-containing protein [Agromyces archimandritae]
MPVYREKLWPAPWIFIAALLLIPASILVFAPIDLTVGFVVAGVLYAAVVIALLLSTPAVEVGDGMLRAGRAGIELEHLGEAVPFDGAAARTEKGTALDVRAYLLLRGWIHPVVRIPVEDPADPAPYWLVSTRRPKELAAAINGSRRPD